jgi:glucose-1-phosphate thymidylyltransferase
MHQELIGLIPAAGQAVRIAPLPCSKEIYPVGFCSIAGSEGVRPKAACQYLLESMRFAGVSNVYIVLRNGKWDIPAYLGDGAMLKMNLAYLMMRLPFGQPYTLDQAYPFIQNAIVALGFPDVIFQPEDAFTQLLSHQTKTGADIVLGLFRANRPRNSDMVNLSNDGRVRSIVVKPRETDLSYTWIIALWTPTFTRFMHNYLVQIECAKTTHQLPSGDPEPNELFLGHVIHAAIESNLNVAGLVFPDGGYLDIGTREDLAKAIQRFGIEFTGDRCVD